MSLNGSKAFISGAGVSDALCRHGAHRRRRGRRASPPSWCRRIRRASRFGANEQQDGLARAADARRSIFEDAACRRPTCIGPKARASASPWPASMAAGSTSPRARSAARRRRSTRRWPTCATASSSAQAIADFQALQFKLADMETELAGGAHLALCAPPPRSTARRRTRPSLRDGQALCHRHRLRGRQRGAAAARRLRLSARLRHREASSATFASTRSSKAPTRSCA